MIEKYFVFLSHFKTEAGTEATLMQQTMTSLIKESAMIENETPIFLDSEDLTDLMQLRRHVENSQNLVLLLTPGVLSRPWCLMEIVVAHARGIQIVPVEIQRPGIKFQFPSDDSFYAKQLSRLKQSDLDMLQAEGIGAADISEAMRYVFRQIALPFSPHKSSNIRKAELQDILNRCGLAQQAQ
jgi:hypothetical protein